MTGVVMGFPEWLYGAPEFDEGKTGRKFDVRLSKAAGKKMPQYSVNAIEVEVPWDSRAHNTISWVVIYGWHYALRPKFR